MASSPEREPGRSDRGGMGSRLSAALTEFLTTETAGGVFLFLAAVAALIWAGIAFGSYDLIWTGRLPGLARLGFPETARELINSGLMSLFFFIVGLEIKRELMRGELRDRRAAVLPLIAALGGMVAPVVIYALMTGTRGGHGWGIPMATDIAFALGTLTLFGRGLPQGLRVLLLSIAVADDIGTLVVITIFYAESVHWTFVIPALILVVAIWFLARRRAGALPLYILLGVVLWWLTLRSGVPPTIAGVAVGLLIPAGVARVERIEHLFHPWTSYGILPLFALANAGLPIVLAEIGTQAGSRVSVAILVGRTAGKLVGVTAGAWIAVRLGVGLLPEDVSWRHVVALGFVTSVGFTVPLFVATLAFDNPALVDNAKLGILLTTVVGFVLGGLALRIAARETEDSSEV